MKKVDKNSKVPLHIQLSSIIKEMIETEELIEGSFLMSERDICKHQEISRMTVNKAILSLVNEGLLNRHQGKGTFVAYKKKKHRYQKLEGFTEIMTKRGYQVENELLVFNLDTYSKNVREKLNLLNLDSLVYKIKRLRSIDNDPFILETVYINQDMCPDLTENLIKENSLYQLYKERYQHKIVRAEQVITPVMITKEQAGLLQCEINTLALKIDRVVYTEFEEVMEYTSSIFLTDKHEFEVVLNEN